MRLLKMYSILVIIVTINLWTAYGRPQMVYDDDNIDDGLARALHDPRKVTWNLDSRPSLNPMHRAFESYR